MSPAKKSPRKASKKAAPKKAPPAPRAKPAAKPAAKKAAAAKEQPKVKKKAGAAPAPPPKKAERPPAVAAPAPAPAAAKKPAAAPKAKAKPRPRAPVVPDIVKPGLGGRWECYSCGSKFYDLGRPEPTCPKCGADQRDKPREKATPPTPPPERPRRAAVPMGSLLDEDEEPAEEFEADEEDLGAIDDDAFLTETTEPVEEDEDVDVTVLDED